MARYQRRKAKRDAKRTAKLSQYDNFSNISDYNKLYQAYKDARKGVRWKASVQRYGLDLSQNLWKLHHKLINGEDVRKGFIPFDIMERGKLRHIQSVHFSERIPQKALTQNVLIPILGNSLIYDNGASRKGMGVSHAISRTTKHLHDYYRKYGNEGYVLQIDLKDYFGSIPHDQIKALIRRKISDEQIVALTESFIDAFAKEKARIAKRENRICSPAEMQTGLGLGSEICQVCAIAYPDCIDHFIKEKARCKWYERYNDDSFVLHPSKQYLQELLSTIREMYSSLGIRLNEKKTKIVRLRRGFTFLKTKFYLTDTGKVIKKLCRRSIVTMRRKIKKFYNFYKTGAMGLEEIWKSYQSWRGYALHKDSNRTMYSMDRLFCRIFNLKFNDLKKEVKKNGNTQGGNFIRNQSTGEPNPAT